MHRATHARQLRSLRVIEFHFGRGRTDMKVLELNSAKRVVWQAVGGAADWIGSKVNFELKQEGEQSGSSL